MCISFHKVINIYFSVCSYNHLHNYKHHHTYNHNTFANIYALKEVKTRIESIIKTVGLGREANKKIVQLSKGYKQRVGLAAALIHDPEVLILDEPTAGVDIELRFELWEFLRKLNREGTTIILTTHYIEEAEALCDTIGVIHQGQMLTVEKKADLVNKVYRGEIELEIKQVLQKIPDALMALGATFDAKTRRLKLMQANGALNSALKILVGAGIEIEKVEVHEPRLEEAFLKLIREEKK